MPVRIGMQGKGDRKGGKELRIYADAIGAAEGGDVPIGLAT